MRANYYKHILEFKRPSGTSRGVLKVKETWFIVIEHGHKRGIGECGILRGLSIDDTPEYEEKLKWACQNIHLGKEALYDALREFPSIQFGVEQAFLSLHSQNPFELFPSDFTQGKQSIPINGLVWMGEKEFMKKQITEKIALGFDCIKLKIGAIDFEEELDLLGYIRSQFSADTIEIRVDANGAFSPANALQKLESLAKFDLHSIEQPIRQGQFDEMRSLCQKTPLPIALDEELIGVFDLNQKSELITHIKPQYIIIKPSLVGGFKGTTDWLSVLDNRSIGWWITSALESNVGLNAITQFTYTLNSSMPQGLGTGALYTNNIESPLQVNQGAISYCPDLSWKTEYL